MSEPITDPQPTGERLQPDPTYLHWRHNFVANFVDSAFFSLGLAFASMTTIVPLFIRELGGSALLIGLLLWLVIKRTRFGKIVRAGVDDRDMVSALGINVQLIFAFAFLLGALLAGFGGVLGGTMISLAPGQDTSFLLNSLIVVIIGGMGSLGGAAIGALALGLVDSYADVYLVFGGADLTNYSVLVAIALLVAVLAVRPLGLFGRPA